jgi:hypothetical protein
MGSVDIRQALLNGIFSAYEVERRDDEWRFVRDSVALSPPAATMHTIRLDVYASTCAKKTNPIVYAYVMDLDTEVPSIIDCLVVDRKDPRVSLLNRLN